MSNPMPGWYPDPEAPERQRFWDGNKWTEARAYPVAGGDPNMPGAQQSASVPDEKRKSNPWVVIALVAILAALLFFFSGETSGTGFNTQFPDVRRSGHGIAYARFWRVARCVSMSMRQPLSFHCFRNFR